MADNRRSPPGAKVDHLAPGSRGQTPLMMAVVSSGRPELLSALIDAGADLATREESGFGLLDAAAYQGRAEAVQLLLDAGADPLAVSDADGWTAVHRAVAGLGPQPPPPASCLLPFCLLLWGNLMSWRRFHRTITIC